jgi:xanthine/CO dehydrogenase XdhC/CoxF family maturation factor
MSFSSVHRLLPLFDRARGSDEPLVLATVIRTGGSTYAKPGAQMLIAADGEYAGLLSGGCLEGDLREHARDVARTGDARIVSYDLRSTTDQLFGLGAGCEGAMDILLTRVASRDHWYPLAEIAAGFLAGRTLPLAFVVATNDPAVPLGLTLTDGVARRNGEPAAGALAALERAARSPGASGVIRVAAPDVELFATTVAAPPRILLLGGGPDARPVATLGSFLGWRVTVVDHRSTYLSAARFPTGTSLIESRAADVAVAVPLDEFSAAVVMSHQLDSDLAYLRALAASVVPYVGLLGPAARREKLLADLGADAEKLRPRLRAPVGLDIGGRAPESIALSIVGEVHAVLAGRGGRPFSEVSG